MTSLSDLTTDRDTFEAQVRRHTRELHVHCYRMTGSLEESEDLVQEMFLRVWRKREQFAGRSTVRAWLYRIATNACLRGPGSERDPPPRSHVRVVRGLRLQADEPLDHLQPAAYAGETWVMSAA